MKDQKWYFYLYTVIHHVAKEISSSSALMQKFNNCIVYFCIDMFNTTGCDCDAIKIFVLRKKNHLCQLQQ